ncbi:hypothetical protein RND81_10G066500 [Saponaria officinalis]|uniref:Reverse transcriptase zinc-binding domain-containing protein n=1 Tax=Saponaria officinalis TaxID=3572 RepID=A0AAW1I1D9_SAPOF
MHVLIITGFVSGGTDLGTYSTREDQEEQKGQTRSSYPVIDRVRLYSCIKSPANVNKEDPNPAFELGLGELELNAQPLLCRKGFSLVNRCFLCMCAGESHDHLFFKCSSIGEIWRIMMLWVGCTRRPRTLSRELEWMQRHCLGKNVEARLYRMTFVAIIYNGWLERNNRVFRNLERTPITICRKSKFELACRLKKKEKKNEQKKRNM